MSLAAICVCMREFRFPRHAVMALACGFGGGVAACATTASVAVLEPAPPTPVPAASALPTPNEVEPSRPDGGAPAQPVVETAMVIHSAANADYCIDAARDGSAKRSPVRLFICHGQENQRWSLAPGPNGVTAVTGIGGLCLDVRGAHATELALDACNGAATQRFTYDSGGRLLALAATKCLTVTKAARGAPVLLAPCDPGNPGQVWSLADR